MTLTLYALALAATFNLGFIVGVFWAGRRRDDDDPVEHQPREMPEILEGQRVNEYWGGLGK